MSDKIKDVEHIQIMVSYVAIALFGLVGALFLLSFFGIIFVIVAVYLASQKITITNKDAKYRSLFSRKSIKDIESIEAFGFSIFNSVTISGRGGAILKMRFVSNFGDVKKLTEKIENIKG